VAGKMPSIRPVHHPEQPSVATADMIGPPSKTRPPSAAAAAAASARCRPPPPPEARQAKSAFAARSVQVSVITRTSHSDAQ
jgi:hypothetical protein